MVDANGLFELLRRSYGRLAFGLGDGGRLAPYRLQFELTYRCNQRCSHCFQRRFARCQGGLPDGELRAHEWIGLAQAVPRYTLVTLTGGEPLVHPEFAAILEGVGAKRRVNLLSNATLLDERLIDLMLRTHTVLLGTALLGDRARHDAITGSSGSYERTVDRLALLQQAKRRLGRRYPLLDIKMTVTGDNFGDADSIVAEAMRLEADFVTFSLEYDNPVKMNPALRPDLSDPDFHRLHYFGPYEDERLRSEFAALFERLVRQGSAGRARFRFYPPFPSPAAAADFFRRPELYRGRMLPCRDPWGCLIVTPQGRAYPCLSLDVGSVRDSTLREVWRGAAFAKFRAAIREHGTLPACWGCCYVYPDFSAAP